MGRRKKGEQHSAHARINVKGNTATHRFCANALQRVDNTLRILWGRARHKNGVVIARSDHCFLVSAPIGSHWNAAGLNVEVRASLLERSVSGGRQDHVEALFLRALYASQCNGALQSAVDD
jgi:hypothetical protein